MANPEHIEIIKQGVGAWNNWRKFNPEIKADLSQAHLSGTDLTKTNLREAFLDVVNFNGVNFNRADLSGTNLSKAELFRADLSRADLRDSNLSGADLSEADLNGADLSGADLAGAYLYEANLSRANLSRANIVKVELIRVDLSEADLSETMLRHSSFGKVDLSNVTGLETIRHHGPSTIGIDTIYASKGQIPEVFLRGAGVPDIFIEYMPSLTCNPIEFYSCFISYSHANKDFAQRLHDRLQGHGIRCWLDEHQLVPGDDLHDRIDQGINIWDKVILCCSKASLTSWWVDKELDRALQKEERLWKERQEKVLAIIPVDLDGFVQFWDGGKAAMVQSRFIGDFKQWKDNDEFEKSFENLLKALRIQESREPDPTPKL